MQDEDAGIFDYINQDESLQAGIGGFITGFALPFFGATGKMSKNMIRNAAAKVNLFNGKNAAKQTKLWYERAKKDLDLDLKNKKITKKEYYDKMKVISASANAGIKLRQGDFANNMTEKNRIRLHDLLVDIETMKQEINDASDNAPLQNALKEELGAMTEEATNIIVTERETSNLLKIAKKEGFSNKVIILEDKKAVKAYAKKNNLKYNPNQTGVFNPETNTIVMDKANAIKTGETGTAGHELMHKAVFKTLYNIRKNGSVESKNIVQGLGNSLDTYLQKIDINNSIEGSDYRKKLELYNEENAAYRAEEKFTLLRDAMANGDVKFNEGVFTKIGDHLRRFLQSIGLKDIKFNSGRDVYNFIKDFNYNFDKGKLNQAQMKMMNEGAEVGADIEVIKDVGDFGTFKENRAIVDSYEQTNKLLADEDFDMENSLDQKRAVKNNH